MDRAPMSDNSKKFFDPSKKKEPTLKRRGGVNREEHDSIVFGEGKVKPHHKRTALIVSLSILAFLAVFVVPSILGYATFQDNQVQQEELAVNVDTLEKELVEAESTVEAANDYNAELLTLVESLSTDYTACEVARTEAETNYYNCLDTESSSLSDKEEEVADLEDELSTLQSDFDALAQNTANNICCKKKVDSPSIAYYQVSSDNDIECSESSGTALSC